MKKQIGEINCLLVSQSLKTCKIMPLSSLFFLFCKYRGVFCIHLFIYFLAALGLRCAQACSSCGERGLLLVAVQGLLTAAASRCRARALGVWASVAVARSLSSCGAWVQ